MINIEQNQQALPKPGYTGDVTGIHGLIKAISGLNTRGVDTQNLGYPVDYYGCFDVQLKHHDALLITVPAAGSLNLVCRLKSGMMSPRRLITPSYKLQFQEG